MLTRIAAGAAELARLTGRPAAAWRARRLATAETGRTVVEYSTPEHPGEAYVGKFFDDGAGAPAFARLVEVAGAVAGRENERVLRTPAPISYHPSERLVIMRRVPGVASDPPPTAAAAYRAIGHALAELHAAVPPPGRIRSLDDHIEELIRPHPRELARSLPGQRALIESTLVALASEQATWGPLPNALLHRDFQLRQIFLDLNRTRSEAADVEPRPDQVWVVDWDLAAPGDPAFDLAYFLIYLETHLPPPAAACASAEFYGAYSDRGRTDLLARLPTYRRFNLLRRACRRFRLRDAGWQHALAATLRRLDELRIEQTVRGVGRASRPSEGT